VIKLLFTTGKHRQYERLMQEKPEFDSKRHTGHKIQKDKTIRLATAENKDCPYYLHYVRQGKRCKFDKCIVFDE